MRFGVPTRCSGFCAVRGFILASLARRVQPRVGYKGCITLVIMEFTLYYRGNLKSNGGAEDKHRLRRMFHSQLKELWQQKPLCEYTSALLRLPDSVDPMYENVSVIRAIAGFNFAPLVSERIHLVAELDILLLRPEPPGAIVTQCGDIDNRIKTLLDALKVPTEPNALPKNTAPKADENPFFCLLEDDNLITKVSVETDRLLEPAITASEVVLFIRVKTKQLSVLVSTIGLS